LQRKEVVEFVENNSTITHAVIAEKFGFSKNDFLEA